jgi:hypothetical protein
MKKIIHLLILFPVFLFSQNKIDFSNKPIAIGTKDSVKVFEYARSSSYRIAYLIKKDSITVLGLDSDYYKVNYESIVCFILKKDLKILNPELIKKDLEKLKEAALLKLKKEEENKQKERRICNYLKNEIDEFTSKEVKKTNWHNIKSERDDIYIMLRSINSIKSIGFLLNRNLGCASSYDNNKSNIKIKLENNTIVTFYHYTNLDCGDFTLFGRLSKNDIIKLKSSPIKTIRFTGTDYYHDSKNIVDKNFFIDQLDCIN